MLGSEQQRGPREQEGEGRAIAHAAAHQALHDRHLGKGRELHEGPEDRGNQVGAEGFAADQGLDPGRGDEPLVAGTATRSARTLDRLQLFVLAEPAVIVVFGDFAGDPRTEPVPLLRPIAP